MEEEAAAEATAEGAEAPAGEMESGEDNVAEIRPGAESDSHTHDIGGQPDSQMDEGKQSTDLITAVVVESEAENRAEVTPKEESHKHAPGTGGQIDYTQVPDGEQEPDILPDQDKQPDDVITPGEIMESAPETQAELRPEEESNPHTAGTEETPDYPVDQDKEADPDGQGHVSEEDPPEVKREEMSSLRTPGTEGQPDYPHTPGARGQTDNPMDEDKQSSDPDTTVEVESAEESLVELRHAECSDRQSPGTGGEFDNLPVHNKQSADPDPTEADIKDETTENIDQETSGQELNLPEDQDDPTDGSSRPGTSESTQLEQKEGKPKKEENTTEESDSGRDSTPKDEKAVKFNKESSEQVGKSRRSRRDSIQQDAKGATSRRGSVMRDEKGTTSRRGSILPNEKRSTSRRGSVRQIEKVARSRRGSIQREDKGSTPRRGSKHQDEKDVTSRKRSTEMDEEGASAMGSAQLDEKGVESPTGSKSEDKKGGSPRRGSTLPDKVGMTPRRGSVLPDEKDVTFRRESMQQDEKGLMFRRGSMQQDEKGLMFRRGSMQQDEKGLMFRRGSMQQDEKGLMFRRGSMQQDEKGLMFRRGSMQQDEKGLMFRRGSMQQDEKGLMFRRGSMQQDEKGLMFRRGSMQQDEKGVTFRKGSMQQDEKGVSFRRRSSQQDEKGLTFHRGSMQQDKKSVMFRRGSTPLEEKSLSFRRGSIQKEMSALERVKRRRRSSALQADTTYQTESDEGTSEAEETGSEGEEQEKRKRKRRKKDEELLKKIPESFFYKYDEICPQPYVTPDSGVPTNLLQLVHSFGYDCTKRANLELLDDHTIIYIAGSLVVILNVKTKEHTYLRCCSGGGIGNIAVHYSKHYFAVAEKGQSPKIIIYEYPSLKSYRILRGGTVEAYAFVNFNVSGTLLASVGSSPDYMLTIWNWRHEKIVLRSKAFSQDVYRVTFSTENEEQLTTSGTGHIKFWKMALTFTGLKLQGALGRFGKTGLSDIEGYVELPDGKVVSGSEWGNMLLWEGGLIKVEFCRKGRKPCHAGSINQFVLDEGELISIGSDGYVRVWDFETVDTAETSDDIGIVEMEPINELLVGKHVNLRSMVKVLAPYSHIWFAQDAFGAIWKLDLSFSNITQDPECLFSYHSGKIEGLDASPTTHLVATTALDCSVRIYDILGKCPLVDMKFKQGGTSLIWAPRMVNPKGGMFTVGFEDGVVRLLEVYNPKGLTIVAGRTNTGEAEMRLKQAFKPHVAPVTALAYDRNGELLATGSEDKTVFFFATGDKYEPIGFIRVPGPVRQLQWSPTSHEDSTLLVLCGNGYAVQVAAPSVEAQVPVSTYEIQDLQLRHFRFRSVKSKIQREQELAARAMKKEEKLKARLAWIAEQKERGVELTEEELVEKPEEEPELPPTYIPEEPSPILAGFYSTPSRFWLSLGGYDAGYLYHCQFDLNEDVTEDPSLRQDEPFDVLPIENTEMNPIRKMYFSNNQQLLLCGMENGAVRVYPLEASDPQLDSLHGYWSLGIHDNQYGHIQAICSSYDNQFLVTCGADGNIFSFSILSQEDIEKDMRGKRAKVPSPRLHLEKEKVPEDIEDPNAYSIENAKQKLEYDQMVKEAEEKKASKRQELSVLRSKFSELLMKNKDLPSHMQLERGEFEMDQRIREEMERLTSERIRTVLKELAWEQEKYRIGLHKLQARFRASVEYDTVVVHAIGSSHQVSTYRLLALSEKYHKVRGQLGKKQSTRFDARFKESDIAREARAAEESRSVESKGIREPVGKRLKHQWSGLAAKRADKLEKMIEKADKAKAKILQRKKEWEDLFNQKPSDNYEDPKDVTAIHAASENMGDFRLKTAPNYTVPEHMRMSADRKRHQLAMLEELMHEKKAAMNRWILSLRDLKLATIEEIQALVKDLKGIQSKLDPSKHLPIPAVPQMQPDETPEKRFEYNDEILNKFRLTEEKQLQAPNSSEQQGGFGGFGGSQGQIVTRKDSGSQSQLSFSSTSGTQQSIMTPDLSQATDKEESGFTNLELEIMKVEEIKNMYHQQRIIKKIQQLKTLFDAELRLLRHQKMKLDVQMKMGDLRHITLFEEMLFLKDFEKLEDKLQENVNKRLHEKEEVKWKSKDLQQQLEVKKLAIAKLQEREKALQTTFQASLGENNKFADFLTKVFKKKIKRTKKKVVHGEEDEDEDSDEESDEESGWESDEEDLGSEDEPFDDSVCPDGCDPDLFENTLHLREKRLDIEEAQAEEKKLVDNLKKDHDAMAKKVKGVDASLKVAEAELEAFQREKQQKVNELLVVVLLRLHQVEHVINGEIPKDLSASLVFTNKALEGLQQRIRELQVEKSQQRDLYKEARQRHKQLISDRKEMETKIRTLDDRCRQQMIMKFGRIVDLEILQTLSVNINLEELKISSLEKEIQMDKELKEWQVKIADAKQRMREVTREHTMKLEAMNRLLTDKITLEARLDARQTNVGEEFRGPRRADLEDKERLIELVEVQLLEIDALKEEICLLSRKGGSILPPAQPPLPQSSGTCV